MHEIFGKHIERFLEVERLRARLVDHDVGDKHEDVDAMSDSRGDSYPSHAERKEYLADKQVQHGRD